jgi:acyl carrier protein
MKTAEFLRELEAMLERDQGSLAGDEVLVDLPEWDSLAIISFIALVDEKFGLAIEGNKLAAARTVPDLVALVQSKLD